MSISIVALVNRHRNFFLIITKLSSVIRVVSVGFVLSFILIGARINSSDH